MPSGKRFSVLRRTSVRRATPEKTSPAPAHSFHEYVDETPGPHPQGAWLFVTWHLHGNLPKARYPPSEKLSAGKAFVWMDRYLDTTRFGAMFL